MSQSSFSFKKCQPQQANNKKPNDKKVIIANDDELQLMIIEQLFKKSGYETIIARNGMEAYQKVQ